MYTGNFLWAEAGEVSEEAYSLAEKKVQEHNKIGQRKQNKIFHVPLGIKADYYILQQFSLTFLMSKRHWKNVSRLLVLTYLFRRKY